jgi:excisionase family DNA binding protein
MATDTQRAETVSTQWTAKHLRVSEMTVLRYIEEGLIRAYQLKPRGWWRISKSSVLEFERITRARMAE